MRPLQLLTLVLSVGVAGAAIAPALPVGGAIAPPAPDSTHHHLAGLFHTLDVIEDVDDVVDGDFGEIDPVRNVTEGVGDAVDDISDTYNDVTDFRIWEPFTDIDDSVEDFSDDVDDSMRHVSNNVEDWFN
ncbi:hypothetical protein [Nodosilinea sp. E11]|uniref:hypothetical protein n=1 Tax=Nodosilinea sp. E11 TaxID=3037479 RepID=UPI0029342EF8|nr:hypothetical protein [Nodosilinea sp. E11]WOD37020.1 hypothetical protein RRF56_00740 [Nodosilinea sp. E11]